MRKRYLSLSLVLILVLLLIPSDIYAKSKPKLSTDVAYLIVGDTKTITSDRKVSDWSISSGNAKIVKKTARTCKIKATKSGSFILNADGSEVVVNVQPKGYPAPYCRFIDIKLKQVKQRVKVTVTNNSKKAFDIIPNLYIWTKKPVDYAEMTLQGVANLKARETRTYTWYYKNLEGTIDSINPTALEMYNPNTVDFDELKKNWNKTGWY